MSKKPLFNTAEWTIPLIDEAWEVIDNYGKNWLKLSYNEPQFRITTADQMLSTGTSTGLPQYYSHWSLGKSYIAQKAAYQQGRRGLAYERIINSNPPITYLMETNSMTLMALTIAHAALGHGSVFKMNYMFSDTRPDFILPYMKFAKEYIQQCEDKYGEDEVEWVLDRAHALQYHSIDRYKRGRTLKKKDLRQRYDNLQDIKERLTEDERTIASHVGKIDGELQRRYQTADYEERDLKYKRPLPEENILYFLEKQSPVLKTWQREILRIVRRISQYFYPQMETKLVHEGWASFIHHTVMTKMYDDGYLTDGCYIEFLKNHTDVCYQRDGATDMNPYKLGYAIFSDLKRICTDPDQEDQKWFPDLCNTDWKTTLTDIMCNYKDSSFVLQFLGPKVIRELKLMVVTHKDDQLFEVKEVHDDEGVLRIRDDLAAQYGIGTQRLPIVEVVEYSAKKHHCILNITIHPKQALAPQATATTLKYIEDLWGRGCVVNIDN